MSARKMKNNRREFIRNSAAATACFSVFPYSFTKGTVSSKKTNSRRLAIMKNGASEYIIVLNSGASKPEQYAVQELTYYFEKCTGIALPVKNGIAEAGASKRMIVIGYGDVSESLGVKPDVSQLGEQGYLLETVGNNLVIAGTPGVGTLYGVYHFIEDYLGVRWYAPEVSKIPSVPEIFVPETKQFVNPSFMYREAHYAWPGRDRGFLAHLRINSGKRDRSSKYGLGYAFKGIAHSYFNFVNPDVYFDEHPEYFSEIGGKRIRQETQLCLTNPEVFEIVVEQMLEVMRLEPGLRQYNFSQMDYYNGCQCEKCRAVNNKYCSDGATQFEFVNRLAERASKEFPDKLIGTLAYTYTEAVPKGMEMHPNVAVWLCHMLPCCDSHPIESCERNAGYKQRATAWSRICKHLYVWHYIVDFAHYYNPFPNFRAMASDMRFYQRIGVEGIFAQGMGDEGGGGEFSLLRAYYCSKLLWDAQQDADKILKDFIQGYYGAAWMPLWKYINLLHDEVGQKDIHLHLYANPASGHLGDEIIAHADFLFDQAESAVANDTVLLERVKVARMPLDYAKLFPRNGYRIESDHLIFNGKTGGQEEAGKFIQQMQKHGFNSIREGGGDPNQLLGLGTMFASGLPVVNLDNDFLSVDVVPALAGRVLRIFDKKSGKCVTAHNKTGGMWFPFTGGQENRVGEIYSTFGWTEPAEVIAKTSNSVTTRAKLGNGLIMQRNISIAGNESRINIATSLANPGAKTVDARLRSHLELEMGDLNTMQISFISKCGKQVGTKMKDVLNGMREGIHYYRDNAPDGSWVFRSGELGLIQSFDPEQVDFVKLLAYPKDLGELELELWLPIQTLKSGDKIVFEETIKVENNDGH